MVRLFHLMHTRQFPYVSKYILVLLTLLLVMDIIILLQILRSGAHIWDETDSRQLSEEECSLLLNLLMVQESMEAKQNKQRHQEGVAQAKNSGKYAGRKRIVVDPNLFRQIAEDFRNHKVTEEEAMHRAGIRSRSTFYRRLKEI